MRRVNWSLLGIGYPLVRTLTIRPLGGALEAQQAPVAVRAQIRGVLDTGRIPVDRFAGGADQPPWDQSLDSNSYRLHEAMCLGREVNTSLELTIGPHYTQFPITLLTPDEWCPGVMLAQSPSGLSCGLDSAVEWACADFDLPPSGAPPVECIESDWTPSAAKGDVLPLQAAAAVLIQPEHPLIAELKQDAIDHLPSVTGDPHPSLLALALGEPNQRRQLVQALYSALARRYGTAVHDLPRLSFQARSQRIRFPEQVLKKETADARAAATCIDYVLVFNSLLYSCGLQPLLLLVATGPGACHALSGCWLADESLQNGLLETNGVRLHEFIRRQGGRGALLAIDITALTQGTSFKDVCESGAAQVGPDPSGRSPLCYALDMGAALNTGLKPLPSVRCRSALSWTRRIIIVTLALAVALTLWLARTPPPPPPCHPDSVLSAAIDDLEYGRLQSAREHIGTYKSQCSSNGAIDRLLAQMSTVVEARLAIELSSDAGAAVQLAAESVKVPIGLDTEWFRLVVTPEQSAYVYLLGFDRGGVVEVLFPLSRDHFEDGTRISTNPLSPGVQTILPTADRDYAYEFQGPGGRVFEARLLISPWRARDLERWGQEAWGAAAKGLEQNLAGRESDDRAPWRVVRVRFLDR